MIRISGSGVLNVPWETLACETHFKNPHLAVVTEEMRTPTRVKNWTTVQRKRAVVIAPLTADNKIVLVHQERVSIRATIWEMPAGQIDDETTDEKSASKVALRELREETGYELAPAGELIPLGHFYSSPGFTDERAFLFAARFVQRSADGYAPEEDEAILESREFSLDEIAEMIAEGRISDAHTLSTWARLRARKMID